MTRVVYIVRHGKINGADRDSNSEPSLSTALSLRLRDHTAPLIGVVPLPYFLRYLGSVLRLRFLASKRFAKKKCRFGSYYVSSSS